MSVTYDGNCYTPEDFLIYGVPDLLLRLDSGAGPFTSYGPIYLDGSFQYIDLDAVQSVYDSGTATTTEVIRTSSFFLGMDTCPAGVPPFDPEREFTNQFAINTDLMLLGFFGVLSLWAVGLTTGFIIAMLRKLRST